MSSFGGHTARGANKAKNPMERAIPQNKKYAHVKGTLNTGVTRDKVRIVSANEIVRRQGEVFYRLTPPEMYSLYAEYEKHADENVEVNNGASSYDGGPRIVCHAEDAAVLYEQPYLILDVRSAQEFEACHLLQARSFPQQLLMQDKSTREMHEFRNGSNKLIILYDDGERLSAAAAQTMVHRGYNNVYVLSGGLHKFAENFPSYVEGEIDALQMERLRQGSRERDEGKPPRTGASNYSSASRRDGGSGSQAGGGSQRGDITARSTGTAASRRSVGTRMSGLGGGGSQAGGGGGSQAGGGGGSQAGISPRRGLGAGRRGPGGMGGIRERDDATNMSECSVAESVISRAQNRKPNYF